jgi:hypothetical protein
MMQAILNEVEVLFFVRKANEELRAKEYDGTTRGHHKRMWQLVQQRIATDKFIRDVANDWYTQTVEDIAPSITKFAKEVQKASDSWARMIYRQKPVKEKVTNGAQDVCRKLHAVTPTVRSLLDKLKLILGMKDDLAPEDYQPSSSEQSVSIQRDSSTRT